MDSIFIYFFCFAKMNPGQSYMFLCWSKYSLFAGLNCFTTTTIATIIRSWFEVFHIKLPRLWKKRQWKKRISFNLVTGCSHGVVMILIFFSTEVANLKNRRKKHREMEKNNSNIEKNYTSLLRLLHNQKIIAGKQVVQDKWFIV